VSFELLSLQEENGVSYVTLNRPEKRNAVSTQMLEELAACFDELASRDSVGAVVLSGEGKVFCAGTDLMELGGAAQTGPGSFRGNLRRMHRAFSNMEQLEKVVIAAMHGCAIGAGLEMALACDLRIASEETVFSLPEVTLGVIPDLGGNQRLPRIVGLGRAKELILTGRSITAHEAERIGLVNRVVPLEELRSAARSLAEEIIANRPLAVGMAKRNIDECFGLSVYEGLETVSDIQSLLLFGPGSREAFEAMVERRRASTILKKQQ